MRRLLSLAFLLCPLAHATAYTATTGGNWSNNATWGGGGHPGSGDTAACSTAIAVTVDVNTTVGNSPASGNVVTFTGSCILAIAQNVTLTAQGGVAVAGSIQFAAGSVLMFESASAASPTSTPYTLTAVTATADATHPPTSANRFLITADTVSGTNWRWANATAGSGTSGWINGEAQFCGDPVGAAPCFPYTPGGAHGSLNFGGVGTPFTFDHTAGVKWNSGYTSADSWDFQNVTFSNTYAAALYPWIGITGFNTPSGTRLFDNVVFDLPPEIESHGSIFDHSIFLKAWHSPVSFVGGGFTIVRNSLIDISFQNGTLAWWGDLGIDVQDIVLTNDVVVIDPTTTFVAGVPTAQTPYATCSVTSATNPGGTTSTLTASGSTWTTNQWAPDGTGHGAIYAVVISGGTGAGEANVISTNTAHVLTVLENWEVTPDATSTCAIYKGVTNPHVTNGTQNALGTIVPPYNGNHFTGPTLFDNNGDGYHSMTSVPGAACNLWWAVWSSTHHDPNTGLTNYAQFSSVSRSGVLYRSISLVASSVDPATDGGVHWAVVADFPSLISGCATYEFDYNVMHPNGAHDNLATLISPGLALFIAKHDTCFTGAQSCIQFNEQSSAASPNFANSPQQFIFDSTLAWADPTRTYVLAFAGTSPSTLGPWILNDIFAPSGPSTPTDIIDPCSFTGGASSCDYNGEYGQLHPGWCQNPAGDNLGGSPYVNVACTVPQGVHDANGDPQFANKWASPQSWVCSIGVNCTADPVAAMPFVYACMMKLNDASGFNPACTVAALYTYLQNSVGFSNVSYHNTALGGATDIGAGQYIPPAAGPNVLGSGIISASGKQVWQ